MSKFKTEVGKWWTYQRERFPLLANGVLILAFSSAAVCYSRALRGVEGWPAWQAVVVAFVNSFCAFLQLRLADEFKDIEEDRRYRPYRPVPRGLVSLRELGWLWAMSGGVQMAAVLWYDARLVWLLFVQWIYLGLMSREFFVRDWLKKRPFTYMWSHMLIMPIIDFFATACDWLPAQGQPPGGLKWFVAASFFNGVAIEIGRKIRAPEDEEQGVQTYTRDWGMRAPMWWWVAVSLCAGTGGVAAFLAGAKLMTFLFPAGAVIGAGILAQEFRRRPRPGSGRRFELATGVWTLGLYVWLGSVLWR